MEQGRGQVAYELAKTFDKVFATDVSQSQIANALQANNISYSVQPAETTNFDDGQFDLVIVAQAIHWFDFDKFYNEVRRNEKSNALLCIIGYGRLTISKEIDEVITDFYTNIIGKYWDKERTYIDENYNTIPFPFDEVKTPAFTNLKLWTFEHLIGYLNTWSAVKHFTRQNDFNPIDKLQADLKPFWNNKQSKQVRFPILLRVGKIKELNSI